MIVSCAEPPGQKLPLELGESERKTRWWLSLTKNPNMIIDEDKENDIRKRSSIDPPSGSRSSEPIIPPPVILPGLPPLVPPSSQSPPKPSLLLGMQHVVNKRIGEFKLKNKELPKKKSTTAKRKIELQRKPTKGQRPYEEEEDKEGNKNA